MKKKSKRRKYVNEITTITQHNNETTSRKNYVTTIFVPSKKYNGNNGHGDETQIKNTEKVTNISDESNRDLSGIIKEYFNNNKNWDGGNNAPYFNLPSWFQNIIEILSNDLNI